MKNTHSVSRGIAQLIVFLFLLSPLAGAYAVCCSNHGGVASCNQTTGYQKCKDGTDSPTCTCKKSTSTTTSTKGCCAKHGGVAQCDKATGHLKCKDGTQSPNCTCH
ncbi:Neurogenic locus notch [Legionella anisa]|uniref:Neurogenic locus notch n=1 Tax=Legionella anisa TaxID=28082 RepID=A0AAX0WS40_9GAMM|nr:hypothetical protein [Legionella anisa]AWN74790.1 hypothetical protein DLD14_13605 [Legionella anisa]KTC77593.1 neurogenic locus notch like protein precursor [Legionella anisa]MBN5934844.1 hypothetical protein [Legionella anisa]MCW8425081.1 hypothetical protein [Legionella anisa]MCW8445803.1 hypothetical protein [Legionella anisa]